MSFSFKISATSLRCKSRVGEIITPSGIINTPNFVFCATSAAIKSGLTPEMLKTEGTQIILSNTYHLMVSPGSRIVQKCGGLHKFSGWKGPMLTDSGGYQIFSMGFGSVSSEIKGRKNVKEVKGQTLMSITEDCATFRSYLDGEVFRLSPEKSMQIQQQLGADLIVVLDECTPFNVEKDYTEKSMRRSHRWALRSLAEFEKAERSKVSGQDQRQALYGIVQGGVYKDLRLESADFNNRTPFFGIAIGGSLGADKQTMREVVAYTRGLIRNDRPVHLLGIGGWLMCVVRSINFWYLN